VPKPPEIVSGQLSEEYLAKLRAKDEEITGLEERISLVEQLNAEKSNQLLEKVGGVSSSGDEQIGTDLSLQDQEISTLEDDLSASRQTIADCQSMIQERIATETEKSELGDQVSSLLSELLRLRQQLGIGFKVWMLVPFPM
jgi:siderophore synthetase component